MVIKRINGIMKIYLVIPEEIRKQWTINVEKLIYIKLDATTLESQTRLSYRVNKNSFIRLGR